MQPLELKWGHRLEKQWFEIYLHPEEKEEETFAHLFICWLLNMWE